VPVRFRAALRVTRSDVGSSLYYLVEDPARDVRHRLYEIEYEVAQLLDGKRSSEKIATRVNKKLGLHLTAEDVDAFVRQLTALGFVEAV
jgi:hypothetical protein